MAVRRRKKAFSKKLPYVQPGGVRKGNGRGKRAGGSVTAAKISPAGRQGTGGLQPQSERVFLPTKERLRRTSGGDARKRADLPKKPTPPRKKKKNQIWPTQGKEHGKKQNRDPDRIADGEL